MKSYKDFEKIYIGCSDISQLIISSSYGTRDLFFKADGRYEAYECFDDCKIDDHYRLVFSGRSWLRIYDDEGLTYHRHKPNGYTRFDIYRAGDFGCIIHWHN